MPFNPEKARRAFGEQQDQAAQSNLVSALDVKPDTAVKSIEDERKFGIPASVGMRVPDMVHAPIAPPISNPTVQRFVASSPARAAAVQDDTDRLTKVAEAVGTLLGSNTITRNLATPWVESVGSLEQNNQRFMAAQFRGKGVFDRVAEEAKAAGGATLAIGGLVTSPFMGVYNTLVTQPGASMLKYVPTLDPKTGRRLTQAEARTQAEDMLNFALWGLGSPRGRAPLGAKPRVGPAPPESHPNAGIPPSAPAADGRFAVDEHGFIVDEQGRPTRFGSAKEAALWGKANRGQDPRVFQHDLHPVTSEIGIKTIEPEFYPVQPGPGVDPATDVAYANHAQEVEANLGKLEEVVLETKTHGRSSQVIREFVEEAAGEATVKIDTQSFMLVFDKSPELQAWTVATAKNDWVQRFNQAHFSGQPFEMPLADYLSKFVGTPYYEQLKKITAFGDGISAERAKEFEPKVKPETRVQITPLSGLKYTSPKTQGSNPGGYFQEGNTEWLVKGTHGGDPAEVERRARNEVLAAALINKVDPGHAPEMKLVELGDQYGGGVGVASKVVPGLEKFDHKNDIAEMRHRFALHAWLANHDVMGLDFDNTLVDGGGNPVHVDPGGALLYRGMGQPKESFNGNATEWDTMRDPAVAKEAAQVFGGMTEEELTDSAEMLNKISDKEILKLTKDYGLPELGPILVSRKYDILERAGAGISLDLEQTLNYNADLEEAKAAGLEHEYWAQQTGKKYPELEDLEEDDWNQYDDFSKEQVAAAKITAKAAAKQVVQEQFLGKLFKDAKSAGMSEEQFKLYSKKVEAAFEDLAKKTWEKTYAKVKKQYTKQWQVAYDGHFSGVMNEIMSQPVVRVEHALRYSVSVNANLAKDNAFVENGEPITFYHGSTHSNVGTSKNPWKKNSYKVISFSTDPGFANNWGWHPNETEFNYDPENYWHSYNQDKRRTVYITHLKAKKVGDFRKAEDVNKAANWLANEDMKGYDDYSLQSNASSMGISSANPHWKELYRQTLVEDNRSRLKAGNWMSWERPDMWEAFGWEGAYMRESKGSALNACVANPELIHFKYQDRKEELNFKLSPEVKDLYHKSLWEELPASMFSKDGMSADEVAGQFGFSSGEAMLRDLINTEIQRGNTPFKKFLTDEIKNETNRRALADVGDILSPENIYKEASAIYTAPQITDLLTEQYNTLAKLVGTPLEKFTVQADAQELFAKLPVDKARDIRSFELGMGKHGRAAEVALLKGKYIEAFKAKQDQLTNHFMLIESHNLNRNFARIEKKIKVWAAKKAIGNMAQEYLDRIHQVLGEHMKIKRQAEELQRALSPNGKFQTLESWIEEKQNQGQAISYHDLPPLAPEKLSVEDFRRLDSMLTSIAKYARKEQNVLLNGKAANKELVINKIKEEAELQNLPNKPLNREAGGYKDFGKSVGKKVSRIHMEQRVLEDLFEELGGTLGTVTRVLQHGADDAANMEDTLKQTYYKPMVEAYHAIPETLRKTYRTIIADHPFLDQRDKQPVVIRRQQVLAVALNMGNQDNAVKLAEGYLTTPEEALAFVNRHITPEEVEFVKVLAGVFKELAPLVDANARKMRGYGINFVKPYPINLGGQELEGWYYPLHYDPEFSLRPYDKANVDVTRPPFRVLTTESGFELDRVKHTGKAVYLNLDEVLRKHLRAVFVRIAYGEYIQSARNLVLDQRFKSIVERKLGKEAYDLLMPWLESQVYDVGAPQLDNIGSASLVSWLRRNATSTFMGGSVSVSKSQVLGLIPTAAKIGPAWMLHGIKRFSVAMAKGELNKEIYDKSEMMKFRHLNIDYNVGEARDAIGAMDLEKQGFAETYHAVRTWGFKMINWADKYTVTGFTWLGAYDKAKAELRMSEGDARRYADQIVRQTQGTGQMKDLPAVQRQGEFMRLWTWAATWPLRYYNLLTTMGNDFRIPSRRKRGLKSALWLLLALPIANHFAQGDKPEDEDDIIPWLTRTIVFGPMAASIWTRDIGNFAERRIAGKYAGQGGPQTPMSRAVEAGWSTSQGHDSVKNGITFMGLIGLIPVAAAQVGKTAQFATDVATGDAQPENVGDWIEGITSGKVDD